ncbi:MAG: hypothetical protein AB1483_12035 [Candidatus Zixiibacteriota bacterium]
MYRVAVFALSIISLALCDEPAYAGRFFGNASLSYEHLKQQNGETAEDDVTRETAILNYEDVLFYKNHIRFTANLQRREQSFTGYHEFQPIYYFDLKSYGYAFNARYSPYKRRSFTAAVTDYVDVYYRDWRLTGQLAYTDYPTLNVVYSHLKNFDKEDEPKFDAFNRNLVMESSYSIDPLTLRANYNNLRQVSNLPGGRDVTTRTYSGTVGFNRNLIGLGYASATYNYYDTRRESNTILSQTSFTHSFNSLILLNALDNLSVNLSYSGRFLEAKQQESVIENDNQTMSAIAEFSPTGYLSFQAGKGYQNNRQNGDNNIVEYVNLGAVLTRYFRSGVDTRLTYNRTIFQQSTRLVPILDTSGLVINTVNDGDYILDTYQASLNLFPRKYIKTFIDVSLTHDSDPVDQQRRYQLTRSLDTRLNFSRRLEGRFRVTALYIGSALRFNSSFSENYNVGLTYTPRSNLNMNATYIYSDYNSSVRSSQSSATGYISYTFRRAFNVYLSVNEQKQTREIFIADEAQYETTDIRPRNINGQLLMYLSPKVTLSVAYLHSRTQNALGQKIENESIQSVLSIQI